MDSDSNGVSWKYYELATTMNFELHHGDCLEVMEGLPVVPFVLTDPPYGKNADKGTNGFGASAVRRYQGGWDSERPSRDHFSQLLRMSERIVVFGGNYFTDFLPPTNCWLVWDKKGYKPFDNPFADVELAWTSMRGVAKKYTHIQQGFVTDDTEERFHPTQKPVALLRAIIRDFTKEGDTVLDPFMGSGSTGVACELEGRNFIGIEKDKNYFNIAKERIEGVARREPLFMEQAA